MAGQIQHIRHLPYQYTSFLGREHEIEDMTRLLNRPDCRLLTLIGAGGMGKTRLAIEIAKRKTDVFPDGLYFIALAPLTSPDEVLQAIMHALGLQGQGTNSHPQLLEYLASKQILLLLDNFEHLLESRSLIIDILTAAPAVKIIATSRESLNLQQEWVRRVTGLSFPAGEIEHSPEEYSAIQLFAERAHQVNDRFSASDSWPCVVRICQLVEGIPLAIELASAWLKILPCERIVSEIQRSSDFLAARWGDVPEPHRSIRAVFDHSWKLLGEDEQQTFQKLSVFRGGFTVEAAEWVADASLNILAALMDKSLCYVDAHGRYQIHELLRQFAEEQLIKAQQEAEVRSAHLAYFVAFALEREVDIKGRRQLAGLDEFDADFENIQVAWRCAVEQQNNDALASLVQGIQMFVEDKRNQRKPAWTHMMKWAMDQLESQKEKAPVWYKLRIRYADSQVEGYSPELELCLTTARQQNDQLEVAYCLMALGYAAIQAQHIPKAIQLLEASLALYQQEGDHFYVAAILYELAIWYANGGRIEESKRARQEALKLRQAIGDVIGAGYTSIHMLVNETAPGAYSEVIERLSEYSSFFEKIKIPVGILFADSYICYAHFLSGNFHEATVLTRKLLRFSTDYQYPLAAAQALVMLGYLASMSEDYLEGRRLCHEGSSRVSYGLPSTWGAFGLAVAACGLGEMQEAARHVQLALKTALSGRNVVLMVTCLPVVAALLASAQKHERAAELLGLAFTHPVNANGWVEKWPLLTRLRVQLEAELGTEVYQAAWERGKGFDLDTTARKTLSQLESISGQKNSVNQMLSEPLSKRELEVLMLLVEGLTNREIAEKLFLSPATIKVHVRHIYEKLHVSNRAQAVTRATEMGLL